jgi:hypothetical protein
MMVTQPQWRLKLDVPHNLAVEPGFMLSRHCRDMQTEQEIYGLWRDANTGLIMLEPSFSNAKWYEDTNWKPLSEWTTDTNFWQDVFRGSILGVGSPYTASETPHMFTLRPYSDTTKYNSTYGKLIATLQYSAISLVLGLIVSTSDALTWVLKSNFTLAADEGFVWHYRVHGDEQHRLKNLFFIQWDDIGIHLSLDGTVRVYRYNLSDMTAAPVLWETFQIASPGDIINKDGYLVIIPIPGYGLSMYHSHSAQFLRTHSATASSGVTRGHLIALWDKYNGSGKLVAHNGGYVRVAAGVYIASLQHTFGFHTIRYNTDFDYAFVDAAFDPSYRPAANPDQLQAITVPVARTSTSATATLYKFDLGGTWVAGTDRQGRIKALLHTSDARYTPFLLGTGVLWKAVLNTRDTTAVTFGGVPGVSQTDRLFSLSWAEDDLARVEGEATIFAQSDAARKIIERGDTTWQIEKTTNGGASWSIVNGGLATIAEARGYLFQGRFYYRAHVSLFGMEKRFDEIHQDKQFAFDNLTVGDAINNVLLTSGFAATTVPSGISSLQLPPALARDGWQFGLRAGDSGEDNLKQLLLFFRKQFVEYRMRYDWAGNAWVIEAKPRLTDDANTYTLTPFEDEVPATRFALISAMEDGAAFSLVPIPPEANIIQPRGNTSGGNDASIVAGQVIVNVPSILDNTSTDYLGRCKTATPTFIPITDETNINIMGRRVYDAACVRRLKFRVNGRLYEDVLKPAVQVKLRGINASGSRAVMFSSLWIRRRAITLDWNESGGHITPMVEYDLDSRWESELDL